MRAGMLGVLAVRPLFSSDPVSGGLVVLWMVLGLLIAGLVADWSPTVWIALAVMGLLAVGGWFHYSDEEAPVRLWILMYSGAFLLVLIGRPSVPRLVAGVGLFLVAIVWTAVYSEAAREDAGLGVHCVGLDDAELAEIEDELVEVFIVNKAAPTGTSVDVLLAEGLVEKDELPRDERLDTAFAGGCEGFIDLVQLEQISGSAVLARDIEACHVLGDGDFEGVTTGTAAADPQLEGE